MLATGYKEWFPHLKTKFERGTEENGRTYSLELSYRATACGLLVTYMLKQSADQVTQLLLEMKIIKVDKTIKCAYRD